MATSNEFGPTCKYKNGVSHVCSTPEELTEYDENGWKDTPTQAVDDDVIDVEQTSPLPMEKTSQKKKASR